jgi:tyrosine-protein kinase Etk/Wzc
MQTSNIESSVKAKPLLPPSSSGEEISLFELLIVLARRKRMILYAVLACAIVAAIVSLLLPSRYTATTVILPPQSQSAGSSLIAQLGAMNPMASLAGGGFGMKNPNDMYVAMFKSRTVEDAMVSRFDLQKEYRKKKESDARGALESHCDIQSNPKDGLIRIMVTDGDPKRAAELANGYVEEYRKFSGNLAITEASQRRLFFEQQLAQAKDNLGNAEEALKATEQTTGMIQMDSQARALIETAASLRAQISAKEVEIQAMRSFASDQNPDLQIAEQQLAGWRAQLSRLGGGQNGNGDDLLLSKGQVPGAGIEYVRKLRDVKYYDTIFELLAKQFEMAKLDEARQGALIQIVDVAVPPDRRSFPKRSLIVILTAAVGFIGAVFWVLGVASLESIKRDPEKEARLSELKKLLFRRASTIS